MNKEQREAETSKALLLLAENFGLELSEARLDLLLEELGRFEYQAVKEALAYLMRSRRFFPTLAEILEAVGGAPESPDAALELQAERQWLKLLNLPSGTSYHRVFMGRDENGDPIYEQPTDALDEPAKMAYRAMGSSKAEWTEKGLPWLRKEFLELYLRFAKEDHMALPIPVPGKVLALAARAAK